MGKIKIGVIFVIIFFLGLQPFWAETSHSQKLSQKNFQTLIGYLNSDDITLKKEAIQVFGEIREKDAVPYLIPLLKDRDPEIRRLVCDSLGEIGDEQAEGPLVETLKDPNPKVRETAREALKRILRYKK